MQFNDIKWGCCSPWINRKWFCPSLRRMENIWFTDSVALSSGVRSAEDIITEIDEYKGVITSREGSLPPSPPHVCMWGWIKGLWQRGCRAGLPIYILYTNGCLIRGGGWVWPFFLCESCDEAAAILWEESRRNTCRLTLIPVHQHSAIRQQKNKYTFFWYFEVNNLLCWVFIAEFNNTIIPLFIAQ